MREGGSAAELGRVVGRLMSILFGVHYFKSTMCPSSGVDCWLLGSYPLHAHSRLTGCAGWCVFSEDSRKKQYLRSSVLCKCSISLS
jgi:hypothetical protein